MLSITLHPFARASIGAALIAGAIGFSGCETNSSYTLGNARALQELAAEPLVAQPWQFASISGAFIQSDNYRIYTTVQDGLYQRLLVKTLEATHERVTKFAPESKLPPAMDCYVFGSRQQWEAYTRMRAGSNAPIYLQISAGGYCQEGVFAGYDIGRDRTLSVIAHEAWHQFSWFAFKDRLPSWLEEGMATQNETMEWEGTHPVFKPELNYQRFLALKNAYKDGTLWKLQELVTTHAGRVIAQPQARIDSYYAQLWSLTLFLERSPKYGPRLQSLLADAANGKLTQALQGTRVTPREIDNFTEKWNSTAGPVYLQKYFNPNLDGLEQEYLAFVKEFTSTWPPKIAAKK